MRSLINQEHRKRPQKRYLQKLRAVCFFIYSTEGMHKKDGPAGLQIMVPQSSRTGPCGLRFSGSTPLFSGSMPNMSPGHVSLRPDLGQGP